MRQHVINCDNISVVDRKQQAFLHESKRLKSARKRSQRLGTLESLNANGDRADTAALEDEGNVDASGISLEQPVPGGEDTEEGPSIELEGDSGITVEDVTATADGPETRAHKRRKKDRKNKKRRAAGAAAAAAVTGEVSNQPAPAVSASALETAPTATPTVPAGPLAHLQGLQSLNNDNRPAVYPYADAIQPDLEEIVPRRAAVSNNVTSWATPHAPPFNPYVLSQTHPGYMSAPFHTMPEMHAMQTAQYMHQMDASNGIQPCSTLKNPQLEAQHGRQHLYTMYGPHGSPGGMPTFINPSDGSLNLSASLMTSSSLQDITGKKRKRKLEFIRPPGVAIAPFTLGDTALSNMTNTTVR